MMTASLEEKYEDLRENIAQSGGAVIAFSGGVDSTFLWKVCAEVLGEKALAVTARSETFPDRELKEARELARLIGERHLTIESRELEVPGFSDNPPHRCFLCKSELFSRLQRIAEEHGLPWIFDGSNADDAEDFRPGREAARRRGVRSPLEEAGLGKEEVRTLSRRLRLPTWDKPSYACLSSRFPYHTKITRAALRQVEEAEDFLRGMGMREFRVRHHGHTARIEVGSKEWPLFLEDSRREKIVGRFKALGYTYVALDLEGYRSGSMNETLSGEETTRKCPGGVPDPQPLSNRSP